nr:hypothetical protein [Verrucomicrobiota bacterium]
MRLTMIIPAALAALCVSTGCKKKHGEIVLREAAVSVWDDHLTVGTQMQLVNTGQHQAKQVRITRVEV